MEEIIADYDNPWKEGLGDFLEESLTMFFSSVHTIIDWSKTPEPLDKELQEIAPTSEAGLRVADRLFKVWLKNHDWEWALIHIEVQSQQQSHFAQRMYVYNYRIFDRYQHPVISLAILGDESKTWRVSNYRKALGGCEVNFQFPIVKLLDYQNPSTNLASNTNPIALMTMAHLQTKETTGKMAARAEGKWAIIQNLLARDYDENRVRRLYQLIDKMMALPQDLQLQFESKVKRYMEERTMPLLSNIEERALERGTRQALQQSLISILAKRFTNVPNVLTESINQISDISELQRLLLEAVVTESIASFQQLLILAN